MTEYEHWGFIDDPDDQDIQRHFQGRPGSMFAEEKYSELEPFWKEVTALSNPTEYAAMSRTTDDDHAETVALYFPGGRHEVYEVGEELDTVSISFMDEEAGQHGFQTVEASYEELGGWMQDIIEYEDDFTWAETTHEVDDHFGVNEP